VEAHEEPESINWPEFSAAFHAHHVPQGVIKLQGMVNKALVLENRRGVMERKRKLVHQHQPGSSSKPRVAMSSAGPVFHPARP
jgi:hypothetical protein